MPDDIAAHMRQRGAEPVTIRMRTDCASTLQRHATWRLPPDHLERDRLDQLHAGGHLDDRLYANACAVWALWHTAGLGRSKGVATWLRRAVGVSGGEDAGPEDELRYLIERGGVGMQAVLMLVRGDNIGPFMWQRALRHLDTLDALAARWDGECWRAE